MIKTFIYDFKLRDFRNIVTYIFTYLLLFWFFPLFSFICLPLIIGFIIAMTSESKYNALITGIIVGTIGGLISSTILTIENYIDFVNTMPANVSPDIPQSLYTVNFYQLIEGGPLSYLGGPILLLITIITMGACAYLGSLVKRNNLLGVVCVVVLSLNFLVTSVIATKSLVQYVSTEPPNLSYGYDAIVYLKTVYRMEDKTYYKAHVEAQYNDVRRNKDGTAKEDGLDMQISSLHIRHPFIFYLWKYLSFGNQGIIIYLSILISIAIMVASYFAARQIAGNFSILAPAFIAPFLFSGTTWINIYFPDWWAGLFLVAALTAWLLNRYWITAILLLMAMLSREVVVATFIIFFIAAFFKRREALKPLLIAGAIFGAIYSVHYVSAAQVFVDHLTRLPIDSLKGQFAFRLIPNTSYLMFLYGFYKIPAYLFGIAAIAVSVMSRRLELIGLNTYALLHNMAGASSYWGNHFMLVILFTLALAFKNEQKLVTAAPKTLKKKKTNSKKKSHK